MGPFDFINPAGNLPPAGNPPVATAAPTAAPQPQDAPQNKGAWAEFLTRLKTDPQLQQSMLQTGVTLMGGQRPEENFSGLLGRSLQTGNLAGQFIRQNQLNADQQQQQIDITQSRANTQNRLADSTINAQGEQIKTSQQTRENNAQLVPAQVRKLQADATSAEAGAKNAGKIADANLLTANARTVEAQARALLAGKTNPSLDDNTALLQALKNANPGLDAKGLAQEFLGIQAEIRENTLVKASQAVIANSIDPDEQDVQDARAFIKLKQQQAVARIQGQAGQQQPQGKQAPAGMPTPRTQAEFDNLPAGTKFWDSQQGVIRQKQ